MWAKQALAVLGALALTQCGRLRSNASRGSPTPESDAASTEQRTLGDVLMEQNTCPAGELPWVVDRDGDLWASADAYTVLCSAARPDGYSPAADVIGFDCNDADATLTRQVFRLPPPDDRSVVPSVGHACEGDPATTDYVPLDSLAATYGGYSCPLSFQPWAPDRDGDGVVQRTDDFLCLARGESPPAGFASALYAPTWEYQDCDDHDATKAAYGYTDMDGDGYTVGGPRCIVPGTPGDVGVRSSRGDDCDDADASVFQTAYRDADGDGARSDVQVCVGATLPSGVLPVTSLVDCDDAEQSVHPGATEVAFGDGVDQDCDGADAPTCDGIEQWTATLPVDLSCPSAPDVGVVWARSCADAATCGAGTLVLAIGNRGSAVFDGVITVSWSGQAGAFVQDLVVLLAPGETTLFQAPNQETGAMDVRLSSSIGDCLSDDDALSFGFVGGTNCRL